MILLHGCVGSDRGHCDWYADPSLRANSSVACAKLYCITRQRSQNVVTGRIGYLSIADDVEDTTKYLFPTSWPLSLTLHKQPQF